MSNTSILALAIADRLELRFGGVGLGNTLKHQMAVEIDAVIHEHNTKELAETIEQVKLENWVRKNFRTSDWAINIYRGEKGGPCNHMITTVDVDNGTTPFLIACPVCKQAMQSACYPSVRPIPNWVPAPTHEWYKPTAEEAKVLGPDYADHISKGGLVLREGISKQPIKNPFSR